MAMEQSIEAGERSKRKRGSDWIRKRVSLACDQCRKKKLKCDGLRPSCSTCISLGRKCLFEDAVKKRGLPEGYVRGLETLLGLLQSDCNGVEDASSLFDDALRDDTAKQKLVKKWIGEAGVTGETMAEKWRSSKLCKSFEALLPVLDAGDGKGQEAKRLKMDAHAVGGHVLKLLLPPREEGEKLLANYFTYTNSWLPILSKDELLASYYQTFELTEDSLRPGERAILWAVLAYSEHQNTTCASQTKKLTYWEQTPKASSLYERASSLVATAGSDVQIGHVQALLLLAVIRIGMGEVNVAWLLANQAISGAIHLGMIDTSSPTFKTFQDRNRRLFMGCFYLDTILATCLKRAPRFRKEDLIQVGFLAVNGLEEWGHLNLEEVLPEYQPTPCRSVSIFNHLVHMIGILNDFSHNRSSLPLAKLDNWRLSLPKYCSVDTGVNEYSTSIFLSPHILNLHLTFLLSALLIRRDQGDGMNEILAEARALCQVVEDKQPRCLLRQPLFSLMISLERGGISQKEQMSASECISSSQAFSGTGIICNAGVDSFSGTQHRITNLENDRGIDLTNHTFTTNLSALTSGPRLPIMNETIDASFQATYISTDAPLHINDSSQLQYHASTAEITPNESLLSALSSSAAHIEHAPSAEVDIGLLTSDWPTSEILSKPDLPLDFMLQDTGFTEDYFFELSNLDQFACDQDETYRNLGFLQDPNGLQNVAQSCEGQLLENHHVGTHTPDEWSQWFGPSEEG